VFGSKAFAWFANDKRRKVDAKNYLGYFLGYEGAAYRLWLPHTKKVIQSFVEM
jgi:hypothetical protein